MTRKHPGPRMDRLERLARERPCPGCGRVAGSGPPAEEPEWALVDAAERGELAGLVSARSMPPCPRCGRSGHDLSRMTDEQLDRTLWLLRKVCGRESLMPANIDKWLLSLIHFTFLFSGVLVVHGVEKATCGRLDRHKALTTSK